LACLFNNFHELLLRRNAARPGTSDACPGERVRGLHLQYRLMSFRFGRLETRLKAFAAQLRRPEKRIARETPF